MYGEANTTVFLESSIFHDNYAKIEGGVLSLESGSRVTLRSCNFSNNRLANSGTAKGTVIYGANNVSIVAQNSHFENHGYPTPDGNSSYDTGLW